MINDQPEDTRPNSIGDNNIPQNPVPDETGYDYPGGIEQTLPIRANMDLEQEKKPDKRFRRWPVILGGIFAIILLGSIGGFFGYQQGINLRIQQQDSELAMASATQFALAEQDILSGNLDTAQRRLEFVIQVDPTFPGASEKLAQVLMELAIKNQPTEVPTPTLSPTPDIRGEEDLFQQIQDHLRAGDWDAAITTIELIRMKNPDYRVIDVDGLYYIALRNRGVDKILREGSLELGIYDLTLAQRFGPMDRDADGYRNWARYYLSGASFWEVDWLRVMEYFNEVYRAFPNLRDSSGWTASERYRLASIGYGDQLAEDENWCGARDYYWNALQISDDIGLAPTATRVAYLCSPPTATPGPTEIVPVEQTPGPPNGGGPPGQATPIVETPEPTPTKEDE